MNSFYKDNFENAPQELPSWEDVLTVALDTRVLSPEELNRYINWAMGRTDASMRFHQHRADYAIFLNNYRHTKGEQE